MKFLQIKNLSFYYSVHDEQTEEVKKYKALDDISLEIEEGSFVCILGHNGCGKSTLAKHLNATLLSSSGEVIVEGLSSNNPSDIWEIRKRVGMVFQNPDNQLVATIVEDDVAFGVENLGLDRQTMLDRIDFALDAVDMQQFRYSNLAYLSGGQKQRVAIAGILAMQPKCIVLDEPTAMLDPKGRKEILETIKYLSKEKKITIILITHHMEEVVDSDRLIVMEKGKVVLDDKPVNVFKNVDLLKELKLDIPEAIKIANGLKSKNINLDSLSIEDLANKLLDIGFNKDKIYIEHKEKQVYNEHIIELKNIGHIYSKDTIFEKRALKDINLDIKNGEFFGIIGHTGSGKSTLIQILNALIKANEGELYINRENIYNKNISLKSIRQKVGVVFQYPEYQLFEESVFKDVAFAPTNMGLSKEEIEKRTIEALDIVGLDSSYYNKSPFELSGGEKRRVAVAGILAMKPDVLVFDELASGLDPIGRDEIFSKIKNMQQMGITIVFVSHSMDDVAFLCDRVAVLNKGELILKGDTKEVFKNVEILIKAGLDIPKCSKLFYILNKKGYNFDEAVFTTEEAIKILEKALI